MVYCCVPFCRARKASPKYRGVSFHEIPSSDELRMKWLAVISREGDRKGSEWIPSDHSVVCSLHFVKENFKENSKVKQLKTGSVPSLFPDYPTYKRPSTSTKRKKKRDANTEASNECHVSNFIVENADNMLGNTEFVNVNSVGVVKVEPCIKEEIEEVTVKSEPQEDSWQMCTKQEEPKEEVSVEEHEILSGFCL
ncbi:peroxynitrite isomerase THAP4-like isoform X14 [Periplaneta americana]|uniref:peroxynitrite isomerase THAP4-like isoform X14 n=1 Tax=Periplaneta americana TaxID=6978 RepID=UPI0037E751B8